MTQQDPFTTVTVCTIVAGLIATMIFGAWVLPVLIAGLYIGAMAKRAVAW